MGVEACTKTIRCRLCFFGSETSGSVGDPATLIISTIPIQQQRARDSLDVQHLCPRQNLDPLSARDVVRNLGSKLVVAHHQDFQVLQVGNDNGLQSVGHHVSGSGVGSVTDRGHGGLTLESSSDSVVNTCDAKQNEKIDRSAGKKGSPLGFRHDSLTPWYRSD
jgi:hypothetical protein